MKKPTLIALAGLAILMGAAGPLAPVARAGATGLKAFYRRGQTFITWKEDGTVSGEWYKIYRSDKPITQANLKDSEWIAKIPEGSRQFRWAPASKRKKLGKSAFRGCPGAAKCLEGIQLEDDENSGKILPEGTGVFVSTIKKTGARFYAVTIEKDGKENTAITKGANTLAESVAEKVETPGAILVAKTGSNLHVKNARFVYLFFTDFEVWNPDKIDDNWEGYAHLCHVAVPPEADGTKTFPLAVRLHAYGAYQDWLGIGAKGTAGLSLLDYHLTWWYGYSDSLPRRTGKGYGAPPAKGTICNFTEQRVIQAIRWLASKPENCKAHVDPTRVHVYGQSMGGSGVNVFGMRHGEIFAGARSTEGITNWALPKKIQGWSLIRHLGPLERNDMTNEGVPVYEALNMPKWLGDHPEIETPYLDVAHGTMDTVISFHSVPDFWKGLEKGKHPYSAGWEIFGHTPGLRSWGPMSPARIRRDEALPAFANASCNTSLNSSFRLIGKCDSFTATTLTIKPGIFKKSPYTKDGSFPPDLAGKTLTLYPINKCRKWWTIKSNTATTVTIEDGDMVAYEPPVSSWHIILFRNKHKRKPTAEDLRAIGEQYKKSFLICDGEPRGQRNAFFAWSSRNQNFDPASKADDIVDEQKRFAICIRLGKNRFYGETPETATADVTPRRCQNFKPKPGAKVAWENISFADPRNPKKVAAGEVTVGEHGLVTVPKFQIGKKGWGNRLVLTIAGG